MQKNPKYRAGNLVWSWVLMVGKTVYSAEDLKQSWHLSAEAAMEACEAAYRHFYLAANGHDPDELVGVMPVSIEVGLPSGKPPRPAPPLSAIPERFAAKPAKDQEPEFSMDDWD